ncbi:MAG: response regulator transcription factor [Bacteroidales bacterium]|nr:response regulator transcription factor [Bacteroidales bacterium]
MVKTKILLAEDDTDLGNVLAQYLDLQGYEIVLARDGGEAWQLFNTSNVDLCILDVMMPLKDGFELAKQISSKSPDTPFIFLTAKGLKEDRIKGLKLGADDYICKPFEVDELVLRIQNILKRTGLQEIEKYEIGQYTFINNELLLKGFEKELILTVKEAKLLKYFLDHQNKLIKREDILIELWGENDYFLGRSMDVFISRLRKFLHDEKSISIETVRGAGFIFRRS